MPNFVKIKIEDDDGKVLKHHYLRLDKYDLPAGKIEENESSKKAAARELLERTGFAIEEDNLQEIGMADEFLLFTGKKRDLVKITEPGEKGGYSTDIKWE